MTAEEFLLDKWNNCICIRNITYDSNDIYIIYDPIYIRNIKLNSLDNNTNEILPNKQSILFKIDNKYDFLYVDHTKIWEKLQDDYNLNYLQTRELIQKTLLNIKMPICINFKMDEQVLNNKLKKLKPHSIKGIIISLY